MNFKPPETKNPYDTRAASIEHLEIFGPDRMNSIKKETKEKEKGKEKDKKKGAKDHDDIVKSTSSILQGDSIAAGDDLLGHGMNEVWPSPKKKVDTKKTQKKKKKAKGAVSDPSDDSSSESDAPSVRVSGKKKKKKGKSKMKESSSSSSDSETSPPAQSSTNAPTSEAVRRDLAKAREQREVELLKSMANISDVRSSPEYSTPEGKVVGDELLKWVNKQAEKPTIRPIGDVLLPLVSKKRSLRKSQVHVPKVTIMKAVTSGGGKPQFEKFESLDNDFVRMCDERTRPMFFNMLSNARNEELFDVGCFPGPEAGQRVEYFKRGSSAKLAVLSNSIFHNIFTATELNELYGGSLSPRIIAQLGNKFDAAAQAHIDRNVNPCSELDYFDVGFGTMPESHVLLENSDMHFHQVYCLRAKVMRSDFVITRLLTKLNVLNRVYSNIIRQETTMRYIENPFVYITRDATDAEDEILTDMFTNKPQYLRGRAIATNDLAEPCGAFYATLRSYSCRFDQTMSDVGGLLGNIQGLVIQPTNYFANVAAASLRRNVANEALQLNLSSSAADMLIPICVSEYIDGQGLCIKFEQYSESRALECFGMMIGLMFIPIPNVIVPTAWSVIIQETFYPSSLPSARFNALMLGLANNVLTPRVSTIDPTRSFATPWTRGLPTDYAIGNWPLLDLFLDWISEVTTGRLNVGNTVVPTMIPMMFGNTCYPKKLYSMAYYIDTMCNLMCVNPAYTHYTGPLVDGKFAEVTVGTNVFYSAGFLCTSNPVSLGIDTDTIFQTKFNTLRATFKPVGQSWLSYFLSVADVADFIRFLYYFDRLFDQLVIAAGNIPLELTSLLRYDFIHSGVRQLYDFKDDAKLFMKMWVDKASYLRTVCNSILLNDKSDGSYFDIMTGKCHLCNIGMTKLLQHDASYLNDYLNFWTPLCQEAVISSHGKLVPVRGGYAYIHDPDILAPAATIMNFISPVASKRVAYMRSQGDLTITVNAIVERIYSDFTHTLINDLDNVELVLKEGDIGFLTTAASLAQANNYMMAAMPDYGHLYPIIAKVVTSVIPMTRSGSSAALMIDWARYVPALCLSVCVLMTLEGLIPHLPENILNDQFVDPELDFDDLMLTTGDEDPDYTTKYFTVDARKVLMEPDSLFHFDPTYAYESNYIDSIRLIKPQTRTSGDYEPAV